MDSQVSLGTSERGTSLLTWGSFGGAHPHAAAVLGDAVVCDLGDDLRVRLEVEEQDVVGLQVAVDDHRGVQVSSRAAGSVRIRTKCVDKTQRTTIACVLLS